MIRVSTCVCVQCWTGLCSVVCRVCVWRDRRSLAPARGGPARCVGVRACVLCTPSILNSTHVCNPTTKCTDARSTRAGPGGARSWPCASSTQQATPESSSFLSRLTPARGAANAVHAPKLLSSLSRATKADQEGMRVRKKERKRENCRPIISSARRPLHVLVALRLWRRARSPSPELRSPRCPAC